MSKIGPEVRPANKLLGALVGLVFVLLMPAALAVGVAAAVRQEVSLSILAFYIAGGGVLAAMSAAKVGVTEPVFEQEYLAWADFEIHRAAGVIGSGALEHLRQMASKGIKVPSVAFDMAEALRWRTVGTGYSESVAGFSMRVSTERG